MMLSIFDPWLWVAAAAVLGAVEVILPGYVLLGFGIGAAAIGAALFPFDEQARALPNAPLTLIAIWAAISLIAWFVLTALFGRSARRRSGERDVNDFDNSP